MKINHDVFEAMQAVASLAVLFEEEIIHPASLNTKEAQTKASTRQILQKLLGLVPNDGSFLKEFDAVKIAAEEVGKLAAGAHFYFDKEAYELALEVDTLKDVINAYKANKRTEVGAALGSALGNAFAKSLEKLLELKIDIKPILEEIEQTGGIPQEYRALLNTPRSYEISARLPSNSPDFVLQDCLGNVVERLEQLKAALESKGNNDFESLQLKERVEIGKRERLRDEYVGSKHETDGWSTTYFDSPQVSVYQKVPDGVDSVRGPKSKELDLIKRDCIEFVKNLHKQCLAAIEPAKKVQQALYSELSVAAGI